MSKQARNKDHRLFGGQTKTVIIETPDHIRLRVSKREAARIVFPVDYFYPVTQGVTIAKTVSHS